MALSLSLSKNETLSLWEIVNAIKREKLPANFLNQVTWILNSSAFSLPFHNLDFLRLFLLFEE